MQSDRKYFDSAAAGMRTCQPSAYRSVVRSALQAMRRGRLVIDMPEGARETFGGEPQPMPAGVGAAARICVVREAFFRKCVLSGDIGFAESYMDGDWTSPDLVAVVAWFILNIDDSPTLSGSRRGSGIALNLLRYMNRLGHLMRPNSPMAARRNISKHYDLSNDFFALFLDSGMMYSAAKWTRPGMTLEEAQAEKNEILCRKLRLRPEDHVLEIGTGWGGWAVHAARNHRCRVTTLTLSRQQFEYASRRIEREGLQERVQVQLRDFRGAEGVYDKVVSIEMMEALGHRYLPGFCRVVSRSLKRDGLAALQFITCPDSRYEELRRGVDFIQKHVFPGSLLLSLNRVSGLMSRHGGFMLHEAEDLGTDYAVTLRRWAEAFAARLPDVRALGFDERFVRKWRYYLAYCEAAFALRNISVVQTVYTRSNNAALWA